MSCPTCGSIRHSIRGERQEPLPLSDDQKVPSYRPHPQYPDTESKPSTGGYGGPDRIQSFGAPPEPHMIRQSDQSSIVDNSNYPDKPISYLERMPGGINSNILHRGESRHIREFAPFKQPPQTGVMRADILDSFVKLFNDPILLKYKDIYQRGIFACTIPSQLQGEVQILYVIVADDRTPVNTQVPLSNLERWGSIQIKTHRVDQAPPVRLPAMAGRTGTVSDFLKNTEIVRWKRVDSERVLYNVTGHEHLRCELIATKNTQIAETATLWMAIQTSNVILSVT